MLSPSAYIRCGACGTINLVPADRLKDTPRCGKCKNTLHYTQTPVDSTSGDFEREVVSWPGAVLVEFWTPRCGYCRMVAPAVEEIAREKAGLLKVVRVNVDYEPLLVQRFGIRGTPMFVLLRNGMKLGDISGALPKDQLEAWIDSSL